MFLSVDGARGRVPNLKIHQALRRYIGLLEFPYEPGQPLYREGHRALSTPFSSDKYVQKSCGRALPIDIMSAFACLYFGIAGAQGARGIGRIIVIRTVRFHFEMIIVEA